MQHVQLLAQANVGIRSVDDEEVQAELQPVVNDTVVMMVGWNVPFAFSACTYRVHFSRTLNTPSTALLPFRI